MIIKSFELNKINLNINKLILFHGNNEGFKNQSINLLIKNKSNIFTYEENDILENQNNFLEDLFSRSLFDKEKIVIIKRASEKIIKIIDDILIKDINDIIIIINSKNLEKKSKLRSIFEKNKNLICVAFYPDNEQTLSKLALNFFNSEKILISQSDINKIINKCNGDRTNLFNELNKLKNYVRNGKKLESEVITKLTNLSENHNISELIDNCLAKNKKKIIYILNENNYSNEDSIPIVRTFLSKSKKILKLSCEYNKNRDINLTISEAKPPIFWKDKEIIKQQLEKWSPENLKLLIYRLSEIELIIKKNLNISLNLITDLLLEQASNNSSN